MIYVMKKKNYDISSRGDITSKKRIMFMKNLSKVSDYQDVKTQISVNENVKNIIHFSKISPVRCVRSKTSSQIPRLILLNCQVSKLSSAL